MSTHISPPPPPHHWGVVLTHLWPGLKRSPPPDTWWPPWPRRQFAGLHPPTLSAPWLSSGWGHPWVTVRPSERALSLSFCGRQWDRQTNTQQFSPDNFLLFINPFTSNSCQYMKHAQGKWRPIERQANKQFPAVDFYWYNSSLPNVWAGRECV